MLLKKKLLKILSVLVAVIIAFSSFCISASAAQYNDFDLELYFVLLVYNDDGDVIDEIEVALEDIKFNSVNTCNPRFKQSSIILACERGPVDITTASNLCILSASSKAKYVLIV